MKLENMNARSLRLLGLLVLTLLTACSSTTTRFFYWSPSRPDYHEGEMKPWNIGEVAVIDKRPYDWIGYTRNSKGEIQPLFLSQNLEKLLWEIIVDEFEDNHYVITKKPDDPLMEIEIRNFEALPVRGDYGISLARVGLIIRRYRREGGLNNSKGKLDGIEEAFASVLEEIPVKFDAGQASSTLSLTLKKAVGQVLQSHLMHSHLHFKKIPLNNPIYQYSPQQRQKRKWHKPGVERYDF